MRTVTCLKILGGSVEKKFPYEILRVQGPREEGQIAQEKYLLSLRERHSLPWGDT